MLDPVALAAELVLVADILADSDVDFEVDVDDVSDFAAALLDVECDVVELALTPAAEKKGRISAASPPLFSSAYK